MSDNIALAFNYILHNSGPCFFTAYFQALKVFYVTEEGVQDAESVFAVLIGIEGLFCWCLTAIGALIH